MSSVSVWFFVHSLVCTCVQFALDSCMPMCKNHKKNSSWSFSGKQVNRKTSAQGVCMLSRTFMLQLLHALISSFISPLHSPLSEPQIHRPVLTRKSRPPTVLWLPMWVEEHGYFIWYWADLKEQITQITQPHVIPNSHGHISLMHITHKDLFSMLKLLCASVTPVVTIGKTNVECLIQKDMNNNFKTDNKCYQIIEKVQVKIMESCLWDVTIMSHTMCVYIYVKIVKINNNFTNYVMNYPSHSCFIENKNWIKLLNKVSFDPCLVLCKFIY